MEIAKDHSFLRPRRLAIGGSSRLDASAASFFESLGRELADDRGLIIVTGGLKHLPGTPNSPCADWAIANGAAIRLGELGIPVEERIETVHPEYDAERVVRFKLGVVIIEHRKSSQARRFRFVQSSDALVTIGGEKGTQSVIDMALAVERPVLPLPFAGGSSRERWDQNRRMILTWFGITDDQARNWEGSNLDELDSESADRLVSEVKERLVSGIRRKCFVIMPFTSAPEEDPVYDAAVKPAVLESGLYPKRADEFRRPGNAITMMIEGIISCDCAVADITGLNPNVMYEIGFAHALGKRVVILKSLGSSDTLDPQTLPFDVRAERILSYGDDHRKLMADVVSALREA